MSDAFLDGLTRALGASHCIERELSAGHAARVFVAEEIALSRRVVIKAFSSHAASGLSIERFRQEMLFTARLQHSHIVPVLHADFAGGVPYYVMPYVEGRTLRERLVASGTLSVDETITILRDVLSALAYAHDRGIVHRDIKPENVLLSPGGAVVTDFGIAKAFDAAIGESDGTTEKGVALGTPAYMSPEQVVADPLVDHRADLYAVGALGYEMLEGKQLFGGRTTPAVFRAQVLEAPPPLSRTDVPADVAALLMRALAKRPADRPQSAVEMLRALGVDAPTAGPAAAPAARGRWQGVLAGAVAALATVAALGWLATPVALRATLRTAMTRDAATLHPGRVVVVPFENETDDSAFAPIGQLAADWITQALSRTGVVQVVDSRTAQLDARVVRELPWLVRGDRVRAVARETGASIVIWGRFYRDSSELRMMAQVLDARDGRILRTIDPVSGPLAHPTQVIERVRERTMGALAMVIDTGTTWTVGMAPPPSYAAYAEAVRGTESFLADDTTDAFRRLAHAASLDSTYLLPLIVAAYARSDIGLNAPDAGNLRVAEALLARAARHRATAIPADRLMIDFLRAQLRGELDTALRIGEEAIRIMPSSDNAVIVGALATAAGRPQAALRIMQTIDPDRGTRLMVPAVWRWTLVALHLAGDLEREAAAAERARRRFPDDAARSNCGRPHSAAPPTRCSRDS